MDQLLQAMEAARAEWLRQPMTVGYDSAVWRRYRSAMAAYAVHLDEAQQARQGAQAMHYSNGRKANEGDFVVGKIQVGSSPPQIAAGRIHQLNPGSQSCNAVFVVSTLSGTYQQSVTVGELVHAEDAFNAAKSVEAAKAPPA